MIGGLKSNAMAATVNTRKAMRTNIDFCSDFERKSKFMVNLPKKMIKLYVRLSIYEITRKLQ
jgi:hypothetical protein